MSGRARRLTISFMVTALTLLAVPDAFAQEADYAATEGATSLQTVFDFRIGDPEVALGHLDLIHSMVDDPAMMKGGAPPEIVVVFIGPSVNLISTEGNGYPEIAEKVSAMEGDGVQVENGWISLADYQQQGYAMIADF